MSHPPEGSDAPANFVCVDRERLDTATAYGLLVGCVVPRPVAWITTVNAAGLVNAAPFSSYNCVATSPPMIGVNIARRAGDSALKDSARNILETREFVVDVAIEATMDLMHRSAWDYGPERAAAPLQTLWQ